MSKNNSTIFKTITSSVDKSKKTLALFNKDLNTYKTNWQKGFSQNGLTGGIKSIFQSSNSNSVISNEQVQILRNWNNAVKHGCTNQATFNSIIANADENTKMYFAGLNKGKGSIEGLKNAQNVAKNSTIGLTIAETALNSVIGMGVGLFINLVVQGVNKLIHANEETIESAKKLRKEYEDFKSTNASNVSTLKGLEKEFKELSKGVSQYGDNISLTTEQYERYKEIIQQIVGMSPSLAEGYDTENGYIVDKNGLLERAVELQEIEYRNELRKITNLKNLKTSMAGYIAEYKDAFEGGFVTEDMSATSTIKATDFSNALYQAFNFSERYNNGYDYEDLTREILESLGVDDIDKEMEKFFNENGYYQPNWFFDEYVDEIANNIDAVTDSLSFENVGLDEAEFENRILTVKDCAQAYLDMKDSISMANESIQTDLRYIAEYADGYDTLSSEQQKFVNEFLKSFNIDDITSRDWFGNLTYDEDKMKSIKRQINEFVEELSQDETTKEALADLYSSPTDAQSISEYVGQFRSALEIIKAYCEENGIEIPMAISDSEQTVNDLEAQYQRAVDFSKDKFDGYDPTTFFKEHSINTQEEIDKWSEIAQTANSAADAEKKYVQSSTPDNKANPSFTEAWNQLKNNTGAFKDNDDTKDTANNLLELAEAGKLTVKAFEKTKGSDDFLTQTKLSAEEATKQVNELIDSSKQLSELKKGIGAIGSAYNEKKDSKENTVNPDTLSSMYDTLGIDSWTKKDKKVWEEYKNAATNASAPVKKLKKYQDELATSYLNSNNFLSNLDGSTEEHYKTLLKDMGIKNAEKIVDDQLIANSQVQKYESEALSAATEDLGNKTWNTSNAFLKQARMTDLAKAQLVDLISQEKIFAEDSNLSPDEKIKKLNKLSKAYFETGFSVQLAGVMGSDSRFFGDGGADAFIEEQWQKHLKKVRKTFQTDIEIDPTVTNPKDKTKDTTKDKTQSTAKIFNWIETRISRLERRISKATSKAEDSYRSFEKRAKSYSKAIKLTTDEIKAQEKAADKYHKKADKSKLSDNLKKKVKNGTIDIQKIKNEKTQKQVEEYQENWEKYLAHKDEADNLRQKKKQYRRDKIELENTKLDESNKSLESENNLISENIEHSKERGQFDLSGNYKQQIANNQKQAGNIEEQNKNLEKLKKTVAEGSEAWNEYESRIQSNNESINSLKNSNAELAEAMYNLPIEERDSLLEEYDSKDELLNAKSENALSAGEKNQYSDEIIANIKSRQAVRQDAVNNTKNNILSNIPAGVGNDVYDKIQSCISSGQPVGKDLINAVSHNPDLYYACKSYNEALLDKMLYDETAKTETQSQLSSQRDNIESSANEQLENISTDETKLQADISKSEAAGLSQSKAQYTEQIRLNKERAQILQNEHNELENWLSDMMAAGEIVKGDEQYEATQNKLKNMDAEIVNCIADQIKFGTEIKEMDLSRLEKLASLLDVAKNRLAGLASLAEAHGHNASDDLIAEQIETSITDAKNYKDMMQEYREQLLDPENLSEWGISEDLMNKVITLVDKGNVNGAKDLLKDNGIDIENLAGFQEYMNGLASSTSSYFSAMVEGEKHYDSLYQNRIDKLSEYLDGLQKEKDLKDRTLALEKARFALEKAKNNLTKKVWNGSQWVYTADTEAVQSAQEAYDNTAFDELTHSIQDAIEVLEKLMKSDNLYDDNGNLIKNPDAGSLVKTADDNYVSLTSAQQNNIPQSAMPVPQLNIQDTAVPDFTLPAVSGAGTVINNNFDKLELSLPNVNDNSKAYDLAMSLRNELMSLRTYSQQYNWNQ